MPRDRVALIGERGRGTSGREGFTTMPHAEGEIPETAKSNALAAQAGPASEPLRATDSQWRIYGLINEWIRFADAKAGALLAANALILVSAVGASKVPRHLEPQGCVSLRQGRDDLGGRVAGEPPERRKSLPTWGVATEVQGR